MENLDIQQIMEFLPHRYPFLLVDRVLSITPGERIVAMKNVTVNEPCFTGHFPGLPILPGVLILESLAQTLGILVYHTAGLERGHDTVMYFAGIDNARFKRIVVPGDQLCLEVELVRVKQDLWKCQGKATVDGELACSADLLGARRKVTSDS